MPPQPSPRAFLLALVLLLAAFSLPLWQLIRFSLASEIYSYLVLIPLVSAFLVWQQRANLSPAGDPLPRTAGGLVLASGLAVAVFYLFLATRGTAVSTQDQLAVASYAMVLMFLGFALLFLGRKILRSAAFPLGFLFLLAPLPTAVEMGFETFLQHGSALTAHGMLEAAGMTVFRDGTHFRLPGFSMEVAPECSGIRSTLALFITSLVAGQQFLRSPFRRAILAAVVIPIALLRNGLRVFTIGELCVQVGPHMIDSWIHRRGGPLFFLISLVPFALILFWLIRSERRSREQIVPGSKLKVLQPTS